MSYEDHLLEAKIHKFLSRKEREHPEMREPVSQLYRELTTSRHGNHTRTARVDAAVQHRDRHTKHQMSSLRYAA